MCIFGGNVPKPALPAPPPQVATAEDADVSRARADEQARLRAMAGSGSTLLTKGTDLNDNSMVSGKTALGQ